MARLSLQTSLPDNIKTPHYHPADHGAGIVHLGFGAFHRAHQALYTDEALAARGGNWRIIGVSLRSQAIAEKINAQLGLYSVLIRSDLARTLRVIGSVDHVIALRKTPNGVVNSTQWLSLVKALIAPETRIVSLTVSEKAYAIDRTTGYVNEADPVIKHDLLQPDRPQSVPGIIVYALQQRRLKNIRPFTVLCCDNLPANGRLVRTACIDLAKRIDHALAEHIEESVSFPCTMVDRITPAINLEALADVKAMLGFHDYAAIATEDFCQWVIEDDFPTGRPYWEAGGALFVNNVEPYELMKLRMLNGAHSLVAYTGYIAGFQYVRDAMDSKDMIQWVRAHLSSVARTLTSNNSIDYSAYAKLLEARFANRAIAHETYQIAMDGTEKLPQRIFEPAIYALQHQQPLDTYALATAAWIRYCCGIDEAGRHYKLNDPRENEVSSVLEGVPLDAGSLYKAITTLPNAMPDELASHPVWHRTVTHSLSIMLEHGMRAALHETPRVNKE